MTLTIAGVNIVVTHHRIASMLSPTVTHKDNNQDVATMDHTVLNVTDTSLSEEEENKRLESSGNCVVNRSFQWGWIHTPLPNSMYPPVSNTVTMIPSENAKIYSETGAVIGRREQVDTDSLPGLNQPGSNFHEISLNSGETTPSTIYRVSIPPRVHDIENVDKVHSVTPLLSPESDRDKKRETNIRGNHHYKVIRISEIVATVVIISGSLVIISAMMALHSL